MAGSTPSSTGVLFGRNPASFDVDDPIVLFIIQLFMVLAFTQILSILLTPFRQPRVIAEVLAGIVLGPTVLGRIPGFTKSIFPSASLSYLNLVSTIGLVLFLFLVGLEVDVQIIRKNARAAISISLAGMIIPFGLGAAIAVPIYHNFIDPSVNFSHFILFVGTAMSITAFPVLCRILTELKLLDTTIGVVVLSAGVGNDVVGWVLLALTVALVNSSSGTGGGSSGVKAVYVLLTAIGWTLFLLYPVRWAVRWLARKTGSLESGHPTPLMMTVILLLVFVSGFMTDIIGVHVIFGGFLCAFAVPREIAIVLVEKIEDLITIIFLPLYFTLSGLKTNLGLLDNGITWGYTILLCVVAFVGKFAGCYSAALLNKFDNREALAVGTLMSCKGLVELIVLNVGLSAGILSARAFSMFVFMAIVLTIMTTPLTLWVYPARVRKSLAAQRSGNASGKSTGTTTTTSSSTDLSIAGVRLHTSHLFVVLAKMEQIPSLMALMQLFKSESIPTEKAPLFDSPSPVSVEAFRLVELTHRMSAVMQVTEQDDILHRDMAMQVFKTYGQLNNIPVIPSMSIVPFESFTDSIVSHSARSRLVVIPWSGHPPFSGSTAEEGQDNIHASTSASHVEALLGSSDSVWCQFLRKTLAESPKDIAIYAQRGESNSLVKQHLLVVFTGGPDDRLALSLACQLCSNNIGTRATVIRLVSSSFHLGGALLSKFTTTTSSNAANPMEVEKHEAAMLDSCQTFSRKSHPSGLKSDGSDDADEKAWSYFSTSSSARMTFETISSSTPLQSIIERADHAGPAQSQLVVVTGRSRHSNLKTDKTGREVASILSQNGQQPDAGVELRKTVGDVATALMVSVPKASFLVLQAGSVADDELTAPALTA